MALLLNKIEAADLSQRTRWYVFIRWLFLCVIAIPGLVSLFILEGWSGDVARDVTLFLVVLLSNLVLLILTRLRREAGYQKYLAGIWIGLDILLVSYWIFTNGGIESRSPILYTIPILVAAAIFGRGGTYLAAISASLLYAGLITADYFGIIHSVGAIDPTLRSRLPYVINTICFFPSILMVIAMGVDFITRLLIDKQQQAGQSLNALQRAQDIARLGSWEWDIPTDKITWSAELLKIFGFNNNPEDFSYEAYLDHIHPEDAPAHRRAVAQALKRKAPFNVDHRAIMPDGSIKYIHGEGRPLLDKRGKIIKLSGIAQDVTEMHYLDDAKREFVSLASHQLRTPASGVKAFLSLLIDGYAGELSKKQLEFLKKAYDSNDRQLDIIDSLLSLASIESGKLTLQKTPTDLNLIVKRCLPHHKLVIRNKKQKLTTRWTSAKLPVLADPSHLQMAIDNLISNAIKYTPEKGRISIATRATSSAAYIEVTDSGIGIAKKDLPALFQKFSRLNDPASKTVGGTGLGLYLAQYIVKLHHGTILARSRPGVGTTFSIKLPLRASRSKIKLLGR